MFIKCQRCELNYMQDTDKVCKVCLREIHGKETNEEHELCTVCNEAPVIPGKVFCHVCYFEINGEKADTPIDSDDNEDEPLLTGGDTPSTMNEIVPDLINRDIPETEFEQMNEDLSLEELEENEESENSLDDDENDD